MTILPEPQAFLPKSKGEIQVILDEISANNPDSREIIYLKYLDTPLGTMVTCAVDSGICLLEFTEKKVLEKELREIARFFNANIFVGEHPFFEVLARELSEYFDGKRKDFSVPLSLVGTDFQKRVWQILQNIPYGTTRSYMQQANILGNPKAIRAVASANGLNKISILVPCHRIIGANGTMVGYAGGIWRKQKLLQLENAILI